GRMDLGRSRMEPVFRKLVENPAYGPNMSDRRPSTNLVSRCGTDIGGAPTAAWPYTLAWCCSMTSGLVERKNCPDMGNPLKPFASGMPEDWRSSRAPPPAPMNTNRALVVNLRLLIRSLTVMFQLPSVSRLRAVTLWP